VNQEGHVHHGTGGIGFHPIIDVRIEKPGSLIEPPEPDNVLLQLDRIESVDRGSAEEGQLSQ
jgi:hypothetical protein